MFTRNIRSVFPFTSSDLQVRETMKRIGAKYRKLVQLTVRVVGYIFIVEGDILVDSTRGGHKMFFRPDLH